jgi:hypothetical protein
VCEPAVRRWAIISVAGGILVAWGGAAIFTFVGDAPFLPFVFLLGVLSVLAAHVQLYRVVRDDVVMAPEANARFLQHLRWFGPAASIEILFFVHSRASGR